MNATVILLDRTRPSRRRRPQEAKVHEAVDALIGEGRWPPNLRRDEQYRRVTQWLLAHGYPASDLPSRPTASRALLIRERSERTARNWPFTDGRSVPVSPQQELNLGDTADAARRHEADAAP